MADAQDESDAFGNKIEKYAEFLRLMNNYGARRISLKGTVSKMQEYSGITKTLLWASTPSFQKDIYEIALPLQDSSASSTSKSDEDST